MLNNVWRSRPLRKPQCHRHRFRTRAEARLKIATWIADFYNTRRRYSQAGGLPPVKFEQMIRQQREAAREKCKAARDRTLRSQGLTSPIPITSHERPAVVPAE
ncbi:hypothetical protein GCM10022295_89350 [Streptomyces osmaniensis]|uniref:Integrase catalytic domain-containing protein n=1 Tax=Streptomyces osmaniensis TaxID=593134 RepID=A0ABP6YYX7_9ACTN